MRRSTTAAAAEVMLARGDEAKRLFPHLLASRPGNDPVLSDAVIVDGAQPSSRPTLIQRLRTAIQRSE